MTVLERDHEPVPRVEPFKSIVRAELTDLVACSFRENLRYKWNAAREKLSSAIERGDFCALDINFDEGGYMTPGREHGVQRCTSN